MKWTYPVLAFLVVFVIGFGLVNTIKEALEVAPLAEQGAEEGRLVANTKNVTRLVAKDAADLQAYLKTAIPFTEATTDTAEIKKDTWEDFFLRSLKPHPQAKHLIVVPGGSADALKWSLPALYYAYYYGSPVAFVINGALAKSSPGDAVDKLNLKAFVIGPEDLLPDKVVHLFPQHVRIDAPSPHMLAVKLAKYRDEESGFGWGRTHDRRNGYFHYVVTTPDDALMGLAALPYARSNNAALLYANEDGSIPATLDHYAFSMRADWMVSPSEGPFRHFWIVSNRVSYAAQGRLDFSVEKAEYPSMGPIALGDTEALLLLLVVWGIASALFVWVHATYTLSMVKMPIKIAWALTSLLVPVLGPILYINAYRKTFWLEGEKDWRWLRPHSLQSATATAMGFGYGAPLMIAIAFVLVWYGFPIFFPEGIADDFFWLGAGMPIMMAVMYVGAVLIAWLLAQYPMKKAMMPGMPEKKLRLMALVTTALSMLAVSLGMMTTSWYMLMSRFPMMPKEDDVLWFGSMWLASLVGFLVAWPINWIFIRKHLKPGNV